MASFMFLGLAMVLLAPMFGHAWYLDLTLPKKWKRLPVFFRRPSMHRRRAALYYVPGMLAGLAVMLFAVAILHDMSPGPRSDEAVAGASAMVLGIVCLLSYPIHIIRQRRWMRTGRPKIG